MFFVLKSVRSILILLWPNVPFENISLETSPVSVKSYCKFWPLLGAFTRQNILTRGLTWPLSGISVSFHAWYVASERDLCIIPRLIRGLWAGSLYHSTPDTWPLSGISVSFHAWYVASERDLCIIPRLIRGLWAGSLYHSTPLSGISVSFHAWHGASERDLCIMPRLTRGFGLCGLTQTTSCLVSPATCKRYLRILGWQYLCRRFLSVCSYVCLWF